MKKRVFTTAKLLPVWMRFYWNNTKEICQLSGQRGKNKKEKKKATVDSL